MANQKMYSRRKELEDKKIGDSNQIDLIPKCAQQPRTRSPSGPKRRTDFSLFFCSQMSTSSSSCQGGRKEISSIHLVLCCQSENRGERRSPEYAEICYKEAESSSNVDLQNGCADRTVEYTDEKLDHRRSEDVYLTSIGGERLARSDSDNASVSGHAPMQLCETEESSLFDPVKSTSQLQNGLLRSGLRDTSKLVDKDSARPDFLYHNAQTSDKPKSSSSSHVEGDNPNTGRGKRKRKPKVHFDVSIKARLVQSQQSEWDEDMMNPVVSVEKARKLKIMRHLGLAAPAGSPFVIPRQ